MAVAVYKYGVHYRWSQALPDVLKGQLRLVHDLREDLVTLELAHEEAVKDVWSSQPTVAAAESALSDAEAAAEAAAAEVAKQRQMQRTKRITGPAADTLRSARAAVAAARAARRAAIADVKDAATDRIVELNDSLRAAQKAKYAEYCQEDDLYWATFNDVLDHHRTAVKLVKAKRAAGEPAALRHHHFDGTGTIAVQLQRQAGQPQRTPETISDDQTGKWRNVLVLPWTDPDGWDDLSRADQRRLGRVTARMRCGAGHIAIPLQMHRMLPADADIVGARLTVSREGSDLRAHLSVTAKVGEPEPVTSGPDVAIHFGWRDSEEGPTVARWRSTGPIDIPDDMLKFMLPDQTDGRSGRIVMPRRIFSRVEQTDAIRAGRDTEINVLREHLVAWLSSHGPVPHPTRDGEEISAADAARWKSPGRFAALALAWRDVHPDGAAQIAAELESWRVADKRLWLSAAHGRGKALRWRDDLYRQVAALLSDQAGRIVIDDTHFGKVATAKTDVPNTVAQPASKRRAYAAPGTLRSAITAAAVRDGVSVSEVSHKGMSIVHAACGTTNAYDDRYLSTVVTCDGCGATYDQDDNALTLLLRETSSSRAAA